MLPARLPGVEIPEVSTLQEMNTVLAERVVEWTKEWKEEGLQQGRLEEACNVLHRQITHRFGPVSTEYVAVCKTPPLSNSSTGPTASLMQLL